MGRIPRSYYAQPPASQAGGAAPRGSDGAAGRLPGEDGAPGQGRLNMLGPRGGLWESKQGRGYSGPRQGEMNLNRTWKVSRRRGTTEAPRAWRSQRRDLPEAQARCRPEVTPGQPRSHLCALGRTMNLSPPTLHLPGDPPASRSSTTDIPSGRRKALSPPDYTDGLAINALSAGHRTAGPLLCPTGASGQARHPRESCPPPVLEASPGLGQKSGQALKGARVSPQPPPLCSRRPPQGPPSLLPPARTGSAEDCPASPVLPAP